MKLRRFTMETRRQTNYKSEEILTPSPLPQNELPTCTEVLQYFLYLGKLNEELTTPNKLQIISDKLKTLWEKTSIPIIQEKSILNKIRLWKVKYDTLLANRRKCKSSDSSVQRIREFQSDADKLFDLACCKCITWDTCQCEPDKKVPKTVQYFLQDQRDDRNITVPQLIRKLRAKSTDVEEQCLTPTVEDDAELLIDSSSTVTRSHSLTSSNYTVSQVIYS